MSKEDALRLIKRPEEEIKKCIEEQLDRQNERNKKGMERVDYFKNVN